MRVDIQPALNLSVLTNNPKTTAGAPCSAIVLPSIGQRSTGSPCSGTGPTSPAVLAVPHWKASA